ncbi:hypothetical protein M9978_08140 [Sphingomonas sp. MG17]|uniref:Uncharacterized protein n=1 Tax=Sphingomonas tagetis TaxID=2949092 RepID=A0A9X2HI78_9SPHN|nr:hypothetical protein [Sphingomonas tagetis]
MAQLQRRALTPTRIWLSPELETAFRAEIGRDVVNVPENARRWRGVPISLTFAPSDEPRIVAQDGSAWRLDIVHRERG